MMRTKAEFIGQQDQGAARVYTFRASTAAIDRHNEIVDQMGWELSAYLENPVILDSHRYGSIDDILGKAVRVENGVEGLEVDIVFSETEKGQMARRLVEDGFLRTVSVGFASRERKPATAGQPMRHTKMELLEISMVAIPANREAVRIRAAEAKAGRRLSQASMGMLAESLAKLSEIQAILMELMGEESQDQDMEETGMRPEEKPVMSLSVEPGTVAALSAFARGGRNE